MKNPDPSRGPGKQSMLSLRAIVLSRKRGRCLAAGHLPRGARRRASGNPPRNSAAFREDRSGFGPSFCFLKGSDPPLVVLFHVNGLDEVGQRSWAEFPRFGRTWPGPIARPLGVFPPESSFG